MNMPIKFDTLEYVRRLIEAGIPADQAEAQASALSDVLSEATVAPSELVLLRADMIARMEMLRSDMIARIEALRADMVARIETLQADIYAKLQSLEERFNAKLEALEARMNAKFNALYWMMGISLTLHVVTLVKLFS